VKLGWQELVADSGQFGEWFLQFLDVKSTNSIPSHDIKEKSNWLSSCRIQPVQLRSSTLCDTTSDCLWEWKERQLECSSVRGPMASASLVTPQSVVRGTLEHLFQVGQWQRRDCIWQRYIRSRVEKRVTGSTCRAAGLTEGLIEASSPRSVVEQMHGYWQPKLLDGSCRKLREFFDWGVSTKSVQGRYFGMIHIVVNRKSSCDGRHSSDEWQLQVRTSGRQCHW